MEYSYYSYLTRNMDILVSYLEDAVEEENKNIRKLNCLLNYVTHSKKQKLIHDMIRDEEKHLMMFQKLLQDILQDGIVQPKEEVPCEVTKIEDGLELIILQKSDFLDHYRKTLFLLEDKFHKEQLFEIVTDELRHLSVLNLLYSMKED